MKLIVERYDIEKIPVHVIRGDLAYGPPLPHHLKMGALEKVCVDVRAAGYKLIGCLCTSHGIWPFGLPHLAAAHGLNSIVYYPATKVESVPPELLVDVPGYQIKLVKPNMVAVNQAQALKNLEELGGYYVPFGVNLPNAVQTLAEQLSFPEHIGTLIVPAGSGVTLAGVLTSLKRDEVTTERIEAVVAHYPRIDNIIKTVTKYIPIPDELHFTHEYKYDDVPDVKCPWPAHPRYELKAFDWLQGSIKRLPRPIYFLNIGSV